ncbi:MAG TPA: DNA-formamidopyrimidine glycosylase family protein [Polyangiales bacterium]|nr:DNA-formamidopyrimidine glycosylase family protein [Polyangiales bacterium]
MPEGDTIFRTARTLARALAGKTVTHFSSELARLHVAAENAALVGQVLTDVTAHGKHVVMQFASGVSLRTHMRMTGSWHIYRVGERWQRPRSEMRIVLETAEFQAVAFQVHEAELVKESALQTRLETLGPDVLANDFDPQLTAARIVAAGARPMCDVLLDQRVLAGLGNVYKSELLFLARVHPQRHANTVDSATAQLICERAVELLRVNVKDTSAGNIVTYHGLRRTTGRSDPGDRMWVYQRAGRPCRECGTPITMQRLGQHARSTYYCPRCQPLEPVIRAFG